MSLFLASCYIIPFFVDITKLTVWSCFESVCDFSNNLSRIIKKEFTKENFCTPQRTKSSFV